MYIVFCLCVCLQARRGHQTSLQMIVSHHVVAGNWTQDLWRAGSALNPEPSLQPHFIIFDDISIQIFWVVS